MNKERVRGIWAGLTPKYFEGSPLFWFLEGARVGRRDVADHQHDFRFTLYAAAGPAALQRHYRRARRIVSPNICWRAPGSGAEMSRVTDIISGSRYIRRPNRPPSKDIIVGPMASYHRIFVGGRPGRAPRCRESPKSFEVHVISGGRTGRRNIANPLRGAWGGRGSAPAQARSE